MLVSDNLKKVALALVIFLIIVLVYNIINKPSSSKSDQAVRDQMTERYYEHLEKSEKREIEYFKKVEKQLEVVDLLNERILKNQERQEKLLDRWEKQTDMMDSILLKLEK